MSDDDALVAAWLRHVHPRPAGPVVARDTAARDAATVRALESYLARPVERRVHVVL